MRPDAPYWIAFSLLPGIGPQRIRRAAEAFGNDMERAWRATPSELVAAGIEPKVAGAAVAARPSIRLAETLERIARAGVDVHTLADPSYPPRLADVYDAPAVLYARGGFAPEDEWSVAVVGTRTVSPYGREVTHRLVTDLVRHNVTIVRRQSRAWAA